MEYPGSRRRYTALHQYPTWHYRPQYYSHDWEDEDHDEKYGDDNGRRRPSMQSTEDSPQPPGSRTRSLSPLSEEYEDDISSYNGDATVQKETIYTGTMVERAESDGLSINVALKSGSKGSNVGSGTGVTSKEQQAWKESKTHLEEIGITHLQSIYALEYSVREMGQGKVELFCQEGPPREGDAEFVQVRWLHIERRTMSLQAFNKLIMDCPFIGRDLKTIAITLLESIQRKFVRDSESGPYVEPGSVLRAMGDSPEDYDHPREPGRVTHPAIFVASPYLRMKPLKSQRGASNDHEFHPRTLLQSLYGFDVVSNRDKQQVVRKISTRSQSSKVLHVDQTWCLLLGSNILITMSDQVIDDVGDGIIKRSARFPGKPITIRLFDADCCLHHIVLPEDISWVDFFRYIVVLGKGKVSDAINYDLVDENNEVMTSERWIETMKLPMAQPANWSLGEKKKKNFIRSQSRTSQSSGRSASRELLMIDYQPDDFSDMATDLTDRRSAKYEYPVVANEYNCDNWMTLFRQRTRSHEYDHSESRDTQQSLYMGSKRSPAFAWGDEDEQDISWDVRTIRSEASEPRRPIHAVTDKRRLITYRKRQHSVEESSQQHEYNEGFRHTSTTLPSADVSNTGKLVAHQPTSPDQAANIEPLLNTQESPFRGENRNNFRRYNKPTVASVSSDSDEKASSNYFSDEAEAEENTNVRADEIESTRRYETASPTRPPSSRARVYYRGKWRSTDEGLSSSEHKQAKSDVTYVGYVEDPTDSESEKEQIQKASNKYSQASDQDVRQPSRPVSTDSLRRLRQWFDQKERPSSQSGRDSPVDLKYFHDEDYFSQIKNQRPPFRRPYYADSPLPVPSELGYKRRSVSQDKTRYSKPAQTSYTKDPAANDRPRRGVRFAAEDDYYSDKKGVYSPVDRSGNTLEPGLPFEVTIPFFHWPPQGTVAMEGADVLDEAMMKLLSGIHKSISKDRVGRYYDAIPECSMEDFFLRQEFLNGISPDGDLNLANDDERTLLGGSPKNHDEENGAATESPKTHDYNMADSQGNDGPQPGENDTRRKTEPTNIEPEEVERKQAQLIGIISHDKALMKQLVDVSRQLAWAFIPKQGGAMIHVLMKRFWGSLDILCRQLIWEENERGPEDGCAYFIRDFSSHFQRMDPVDRAESSNNFPWNECTDCKNGKHYSSVKEALEHLHVEHLDCRGEFEEPFDDTCYIWLHHVWHISYAPRDSRDGFLANMEDFIKDLHRINRCVKELHMMVAKSATDHGSTRPPLPGIVLDAFEKITKIFVLHSKTLSLMNRHRARALHNVQNGQLLNRIDAKIQELRALESTEMRQTIDLLGRAKRDIFLSGNATRDIERLQPQTVCAEFLALAIICAGQNLPLVSPQQAWRYQEDSFIKLYKDYTSRPHYQANRRPQKRVFLDIHDLEEELEALHNLLFDQADCLIKYTNVIYPETFSLFTGTRISQYQTESAYRDGQLRQLEARRRDIDNMKTRSKFLKEQVKQTIEIIEEDHGKAIRVFTIVTLFFLPLSFVSSYMGMNTADVRDMEYNQQIFWISAIPITVFVVALAFVYGYKGDEIHDWLVRRLENPRFKRFNVDDRYETVHPLRQDKLETMAPTPSALELTSQRGYKAFIGTISRETSGRLPGNEIQTRICDKLEQSQSNRRRLINRQDTWDSLAPLR